MEFDENQLKRYYSKIDIPWDNLLLGCWEWNGRKSKGVRLLPYGIFDCYDKGLAAHRVSYYLFYGKYPEHCACHTCDNPSCVNPVHLFDATHTENMRDKVLKNRQHKPNHQGSKNKLAKLTDAQVVDIRSRTKQKKKDIALEFGVSRSLITMITKNQIWQHI